MTALVHPDHYHRYSSPDLENWRHTIAGLLTPLRIDALQNDFTAALSVAQFGDVTLFDMATAPHTVQRTHDQIDGASQRFYKISVQLAGTTEIHQDDRTTVLKPGDLAIYDTDRPYWLRIEQTSHAVVILLPQNAIGLAPGDVARVTATSFSGGSGLSRLVNPFLLELLGNANSLSGPYGARVLYSAIDLLAAMLSAEIDSRADTGGPRHSLVRSIRSYIDERLPDVDLSPACIARAHYISIRQLHSLFAQEGTSVASWIRHRRLERIRRDLVDPVLSSVSISAIARKSGLTDAAHFSKLFRAEYGESPRDWRARASANEPT